ncbi:xanthotoxin 5-hydroxylase CYP82C4-like [Mercurialis annua]|uniref:xanthotoxin 5-hydroxylase CYP82C4-like n=1 Tax=Mercurialis annua TaxID=3986 RepID=UPI002160C200|nr:xanthotoxin 5-hydroxylase CYP82C4-like [Mercurialis annua]
MNTTMKFLLHLQEIPLYATFLLATFSIFLAIKYARANRNKKNIKNPPEPAGAWPIVGHLPLLGGSNQLLHRTFKTMADKLGPIFLIRLGIHQAVIVSDKELARECFTVNDKVFPTRPKSLAVKIMGYNHAMLGFAPYGKYWRDMRKLAVVQLLSNRRLELLKHVIDTETKLFIKDLYQESVKNGGQSAIVEMKERFEELTLNIIVKMVAGKRLFGSNGIEDDDSRRFSKALSEFFNLTGMILVSDTVPILGWLDLVKGYVGKMKKTAMELDSVLGRWVKQHREKMIEEHNIKEEDRDFIYVMLSVLDDGSISADEIDTIIKATCLSLILGGYDTNAITLTWAISLLLNNRHVLKKAQHELDIYVGKHQQVESGSCTTNLVYLQAVVKETLRLYPATPLLVPREAMEDCIIAGYHIPAGTRLFVNLWKMHRDPTVWINSLEFQPERFLNEHINLDIKGQDFECIPFGSGRRMCPGVSFALQVLHLTLARLLQGFELTTVADNPVDMSESPGLTSPKATPLEVVLSPRLPCELYEC